MCRIAKEHAASTLLILGVQAILTGRSICIGKKPDIQIKLMLYSNIGMGVLINFQPYNY